MTIERIYVHNWEDAVTVYIRAKEGFCKVNIYKLDLMAEIFDLIIYPEHRGHGHGDALLDTALDEAARAGCSNAILWPDCEDWVKEWYDRRGFAPRKHIKDKSGNIGWIITLI